MIREKTQKTTISKQDRATFWQSHFGLPSFKDMLQTSVVI